MHLKIGIIAVVLLSATAAYAAGNAKEGKAIYERSCQSCHGATGVANPNVAKMMKVEIKPLGSPEVQKMSDAEIVTVITHGKLKMPPVRSVTAKQAEDVVAYIRTLKSKT